MPYASLERLLHSHRPWTMPMVFRALIVMCSMWTVLSLSAANLSAAEKQSDVEVSKLLVGKWNAKFTLQNVKVESTTEYRADHTFTCHAMYRRGATEYAVLINGTWQVQKSKLTETCIECVPPNFAEVGEKATDTILHINNTTFRYLSSSGNERTKTRVTSAR